MDSNCPICGSDCLTELNDHKHTFIFNETLYEVPDLSRSVCSDCEASLFLPEQLDRNKLKVSQYQMGLPYFITSTQLLGFREKYQLTRDQASILFSTNSEVIYEIESGAKVPWASGDFRDAPSS